MRKIRWGVLGTAGIARGCTIPGMKLAENCELFAIAGRCIALGEAPHVSRAFTLANARTLDRVLEAIGYNPRNG